MKKVLVVSHGTLAEGVIEAAKVILGEIVEVQSCCLKLGEGINEFERKVNEIVKQFKLGDNIVVLADLKGGSPYRATITALSENDLLSESIILTGVNLPMLINVVMKDEILYSDVDEVIKESKSGIDKFKLETTNEDDEL
jgi:N-acetylgalactosamine PTS system EIIA component